MAGTVDYMAADGINHTPVSALTPLPVTGGGATGGIAIAPMPAGATALAFSSGNVANASAAATLPAVASKTNYIKGLTITPGGATAAALVTATVTGLQNTLSFTIGAPAGVAVAGQPFTIYFGDGGIPASAVNTAIVVTLPALGSGNTNASVSAWGYVV